MIACSSCKLQPSRSQRATGQNRNCTEWDKQRLQGCQLSLNYGTNTEQYRKEPVKSSFRCLYQGKPNKKHPLKYLTTRGTCHVEEQHYFTTTMNVLGWLHDATISSCLLVAYPTRMHDIWKCYCECSGLAAHLLNHVINRGLFTQMHTPVMSGLKSTPGSQIQITQNQSKTHAVDFHTACGSWLKLSNSGSINYPEKPHIWSLQQTSAIFFSCTKNTRKDNKMK